MKKARAGATPALWELLATVRAEDADGVAAFLVQQGAGGVLEEERGSRTRLVVYGDRPGLDALSRALEGARPTRITVVVRPAPRSLAGWDTAWMKDLRPVRVSPSLVLVPEGTTPPPGSGRAIRLEPALTFGFGEHPTTRLAMRAVERRVARGARTVLDLGTGSGVLSLVAAAAGATRVLGLDVDAAAVDAARRNARSNGFGAVCRFARTPLARLEERFDLVVANVDRGTLLALAPGLRRALAPGGAVLLTGFLHTDAREIETRFAELGLSAGARRREGDFTLVTLLTPRSPPGTRGTAPGRTRKTRNR